MAAMLLQLRLTAMLLQLPGPLLLTAILLQFLLLTTMLLQPLLLTAMRLQVPQLPFYPLRICPFDPATFHFEHVGSSLGPLQCPGLHPMFLYQSSICCEDAGTKTMRFLLPQALITVRSGLLPAVV